MKRGLGHAGYLKESVCVVNEMLGLFLVFCLVELAYYEIISGCLPSIWTIMTLTTFQYPSNELNGAADSASRPNARRRWQGYR
jgi:hypothetical protein